APDACSEQEPARGARVEQRGVGCLPGRERGERVLHRGFRPFEDLLGARDGGLDRRALGYRAEEPYPSGLGIPIHRGSEVEAIVAAALEDGERIRDRWLARADVARVEVDRRLAIDLQDAIG